MLKPCRTSLIAEVAVVALCVAIAAVAALALRQLWPAAGLLMSATIVYLLSGASLEADRGSGQSRLSLSPHLPLIAVACAAIVPFAVIAIDLVMGFWELRPPTHDDTWGIDHWPMQAALALALPAVSVLASLRAPGWKFSLWTVIISSTWWGAVSLSYPRHAGSLAIFGGWAAIAWSLALLVASSLPARPKHSRITA